MARIGKGLEYLATIPNILKIIEFVILLVGIGAVGSFLNKAPDGFFTLAGKKGYLQFFLAIVVIGWILVVTLFSFFISGLHDRIPAIDWPLCVAIVSAAWAVLLLISSALVADAARYYDTKKITICEPGIFLRGSICDWLDGLKTDSPCGHVIGAAVCGFLVMTLFVLDAIIYFRMYLTRESEPKASAPAVPT